MENEAQPCSSSVGTKTISDNTSTGEDRPLGDLRYESSPEGTMEILTSLKGTGRATQSVRFIVENDARRHSDEVLVLCWVDPRGKLHHYYTYEDGKMEHDECTRVGDAFVAFLAKKQEETETGRPETSSQLTDEKSFGASCRILFSYQLLEEIDQIKYMHQINFAVEDSSCELTAAKKPDDEYRIEARLPRDSGKHFLPPYDEAWVVSYKFVCPPVPNSSTWNKKNHTFYVWGDLDFDSYGPRGRKGIHSCPMNQIVPQIMIGNCLASSDDKYKPSWEQFDSWTMQAQYFWQTEGGSPRALCGKLIRDVKPGDLLFTNIEYECNNGTIKASIGKMNAEGEEDKLRRSEIILPKPFPHDGTLFKDWRDFFEKCQRKEEEIQLSPPSKNRRLLRGSQTEKAQKGPIGRPCLNVEYKGKVDVQTLKSICPFIVKEAAYPGFPAGVTSQWQTDLYCPRLGRVSQLEDPKNGPILLLDDAIRVGDKRE